MHLTRGLDVEQLRAAARGRWPEILVAAGMPDGCLNGRNQPCPKCHGTDRFAVFQDMRETGGVVCRKCHATQNGDGFATLAWFLDRTFPEALQFVAEQLGLRPVAQNGAAPKTSGASTARAPSSKANGSHANGKANGHPKIVATYDYRDEAGELLFQVVRYVPKDFRQRKPKPGGGWDWTVKGTRAVPYRLVELLAASPDAWVFIVEGERDCDNLAALGVVVTCNAGGAGKWLAEHAACLRGRRVVIVPDNDEPGRKHAQQVARSLHGIAKSVRILELPGLPEKGDVSDWLDSAFGDAAEPQVMREVLERLADAAPVWSPEEESKATTATEPGPVLFRLSDVVPAEINWAWRLRIPVGRLSLLAGRPGQGKSFCSLDFAARISTGTPWPDGAPCEKGAVVLMSAEDDPHDTIRPRLDALHADVTKIHLLRGVRPTEKPDSERLISLHDVAAIETAIKQVPDCRLIVIDPVGSFLGGQVDSHRDSEIRAVLAPIAQLAERHLVAILCICHLRKGSTGFADDCVLGSIGFSGIARAVWHVVADHANPARRLFLPGKNNLAAQQTGLAFSILGEPARVSWERGPVLLSADDALALNAEHRKRRPGPEAEAQSDAQQWLKAALAGGPRPSKDLADEWVNGEMGSKSTLERAKQALGAVAFRAEIPGPWFWRLASDFIEAEGP